ncbi:glycosyltransferase [Streptomyces angustmyceticus]|uniref:D-inositol 3-phosphate glycosyltransferase n=1 Tax=Streptomyces angustmyceticus TaxID=285578 RepID=A0A5J4LGB3_9ACTN|nr:glycosyltransferase [Streptomyces angustmyceticus]UAL69076.1 glycosyltransferase [Streptomyces angustmyceticus]GES29678.1 glycosyl transferase [Streptomyces angustmyceticus]
MKVLHVITDLDVGGAEQQLRLLLRRLPAHCEVVTLTRPGPVAAGIEADGTPVTHLGMTGDRDLTALPRLAGLIRGGGYDLVHTHLYRACVYGRIAARMAGVRAVVATEHSLGDAVIEGRRLTRGVRALYRATERLGTATVAVSDTVAARLRRWGVPEQRIHVVPNGIEAHRFAFDPAVRALVRTRLGLPLDAFVIGGAGRLVPGKRFDVLVRAVTQLPGVHLLLAGAGPERETLRRMAEQFGSGDRIHLLGERDGAVDAAFDGRSPGAWGPGGQAAEGQAADGPDIPGLLSAIDVFVSPSPDEAFGLAVLEALGSGLPVLYGSCPAVDELPADQAPGARRFSLGVHELGTALRELRREGPGRLPVPPVVRRYDIARSAEALTAVYAQALAGAPARRRIPVAAPPQQGRAAAFPAAAVSLPDPSRSPDPTPLPNR